MKREINIYLLLFILLIISSTALADDKAKSFSISPFIGGYTFDGDEDLKTKPVSGLRFGYDITKHWGLEALFEYIPTIYNKPPINESTATAYGYRLEALYNFMPDKKFVPYIAVGAGGRSLRFKDLQLDRNHGDIDYGLGAKYFMFSNIAIRGDVRHIFLPNDSYNNFEYTLGLSYYFGGPKTYKPAEASAEPDSDNDGVYDNLDLCPGTPAGVAVNNEGCPLDSDKDGVYDYLDKCPGTPLGTVVDVNGCGVDSDKDGVSDNADKCPDTPFGIIVDAYGCPMDTDKDGVPDYLDICPGTPRGTTVDKKGCPVDSDRDGVPDYLDKCPDTPFGTKVELDGCPPVAEQRLAPQAAEESKVVMQEQKAAPAASAEIAAVAKRIIEKGRATINIEFDTGKSIIKPRYHNELKKFADVLKSYPDLNVVIEGHTDNVGRQVYNQKLSEKRAESIKSYIVNKFGVPDSQLSAKGYGPSRPIASNKTPAGRKKNRRVEAAVDYAVKK